MLIDEIRNSLQSKHINKEDAIICGLWGVDCLFQPNAYERVFNCDFVVAQTVGQGSAYGDGFDRATLLSYIGKNYFDVTFDNIAIEIAVMDSLYDYYFKIPPVKTITAKGLSKKKLRTRSEIIFDETMRLFDGRKDIKAVNVGVVGDILNIFTQNGIEITGTDFDPAIVNKKMFDKVPIYSGDKTLEHIEKADAAIVTGMALATGTIDDIIAAAKASNTKIIVFAETGASFADIYLNNGVDIFISEPFPFYIFNGDTKFHIFHY